VNHLVIAAFIVSAALTSCGKDEDKENLALAGTLAPPEWIIGVWVDKTEQTSEISKYFEVSLNDVLIGYGDPKMSITLSMIELYEMLNEIAGDLGTVKVKEFRKNDSFYEIGAEYTISNTTIEGVYKFKKGDGTYIEVAEYDDENNEYGPFVKYTKKIQD